MSTPDRKPDWLDETELQEVLIFLDALRESGKTNMFGAGSYVQAQFEVTRQQSFKLVQYWMETFASRRVIA